MLHHINTCVFCSWINKNKTLCSPKCGSELKLIGAKSWWLIPIPGSPGPSTNSTTHRERHQLYFVFKNRSLIYQEQVRSSWLSCRLLDCLVLESHCDWLTHPRPPSASFPCHHPHPGCRCCLWSHLRLGIPRPSLQLKQWKRHWKVGHQWRLQAVREWTEHWLYCPSSPSLSLSLSLSLSFLFFG